MGVAGLPHCWQSAGFPAGEKQGPLVRTGGPWGLLKGSALAHIAVSVGFVKIHEAEYLEHIHFADVIYFAFMNFSFNGDKVYKQLNLKFCRICISSFKGMFLTKNRLF